MKKVKQNRKKKNEKKGLRITILVVEIIIVLVLAFIIAMLCIPNSKMKLIKAFTGCSAGRSLIGCFIGSDYEKYLQDSEFDEDKITSNVTLSGEFTNIALFGVDLEESRTDTIIILSINNETGEMKMCSVYRDTVLEFIKEDSSGRNIFNYDKANQAYAQGGPECAINMLNTNLDLNIKDYVLVNFDGLANIIDSLGGLDIYVSDNEMGHLNSYLVELRKATGRDDPDVTQSSQIVHLTGLQATAYCRIRYSSFTKDGVTYNDDYARTERQRYILEELFAKAKDAGAGEILDVADTLFEENTGEDKFMQTSLSMDEILELIPLLLDFSMTDSKGFPFEKSSGSFAPLYITSSGAQGSLYGQSLSCVFVKDLEANVQELHSYLFGDSDYEPTDNVKEIGDNLKTITGF